MRHPFDRHRPTKTTGDDGTFTIALGTPTTIYGIVDAHDTEVKIMIATDADVKTEDIILIDSGQYRVTGFRAVSHAPFRFALLERVKKPIKPN